MVKHIKKVVLVLAVFMFLLTSCAGDGIAFDAKGAEDVVLVGIIGFDGEEIMADHFVGIKEGCSVYQATKYIAKKSKIKIATKGTGKSMYISGIKGLKEGQHGEESGWIYIVNGDPELGGKYPDDYVLKKGDTIVWYYTLDNGKDKDVILD